MRIFIFISNDVIFKPNVLCRLMQGRADDIIGVAEVEYWKYRNRRNVERISDRQFLGIKGYYVLGIYSYLLRGLARLPLPTFISSRMSNKNVCRFFKVPYKYVMDVNDPAFMQALRLLKPDVLISMQGQIFSQELLGIPTITCLNCHPALLPKYRGSSPVFAAMLHGETETGVTVHTMTPEIDRGSIICQRRFSIRKHFSLLDNTMLAHQLYAEALLEALDRIEDTDLIDFPVVSPDAPYYQAPRTNEVQRFNNSGLHQI